MPKKTIYRGNNEPPKYNIFAHYDDFKNDTSRHDTYTMLIYGYSPEDCEMWKTIRSKLVEYVASNPEKPLIENGKFQVCYMLHDKDSCKPHIHAIFHSLNDTAVTHDQFLTSFLLSLGIELNYEEVVTNNIYKFVQPTQLVSMLEYVTHVRFPDKYQYHPSLLEGSADDKALCYEVWIKAKQSERTIAYREVQFSDVIDYIESNLDINATFQMLCLDLAKNKENALLAWVSGHAYCINIYLKDRGL